MGKRDKQAQQRKRVKKRYNSNVFSIPEQQRLAYARIKIDNAFDTNEEKLAYCQAILKGFDEADEKEKQNEN